MSLNFLLCKMGMLTPSGVTVGTEELCLSHPAQDCMLWGHWDGCALLSLTTVLPGSYPVATQYLDRLTGAERTSVHAHPHG